MVQQTLTPTLFLDFDGVLHPSHAEPSSYFCKTPLLTEAIGLFNVKIIVSSSWRFQMTYTEIKKLFPDVLISKLDGTKGDAFIGPHARWNEITACVRDRNIANWRALDDSFFEFPKPCDELISCEGGKGLEAIQVTKLQRWLGKI
jgi:hypothetical protein